MGNKKKPSPTETEQHLDELLGIMRAGIPERPREHWNGKPRQLTPAQYLAQKAWEAQKRPK